MTEMAFDAQQYLSRLQLSKAPAFNLDGLRQLQQAQHHVIPFENFDIALGRPIDLTPQALFYKLVRTRRGGYCFELNGLLLMALAHFGFDARPLLGRVHVTGQATGRGHQVCLVTLGGQDWILDTGFGSDTPREPLPLRLDTMLRTSAGQFYCLVEDPRFGVMLRIRKQGQWQDLYSFDLSHVCTGDIQYGNHFTSTHPSSLFVSARVAALPTRSGQITLLNQTLKIRNGANESTLQLPEGQPYLAALRQYFGIELDAHYQALKPLVGAG